MLEIFLQYFVLYFVVIDPIGTTPLFLVVTKGLNAKDKNKDPQSLRQLGFAQLILVRHHKVLKIIFKGHGGALRERPLGATHKLNGPPLNPQIVRMNVG